MVCKCVQVPPDVLSRIQSIRGNGVLPVAGCDVTAEGLRVRVDRCSAFQNALSAENTDLRLVPQRQEHVLINCPALHVKSSPLHPDSLALVQLRTVLVADHLRALFMRRGWVNCLNLHIFTCHVLGEGILCFDLVQLGNDRSVSGCFLLGAVICASYLCHAGACCLPAFKILKLSFVPWNKLMTCLGVYCIYLVCVSPWPEVLVKLDGWKDGWINVHWYNICIFWFLIPLTVTT